MTFRNIILIILCGMSVAYPKAETHREYFPTPVVITDSVIGLPVTQLTAPFKSAELRASVPLYKDTHGLSECNYGITFGSDSRYYRITLTPGDKSMDNIYDRRYLQFRLSYHTPDTMMTVFESDIFDNVGLGDAPNSLAVELNATDCTAAIYLGKTYPELITKTIVKIDSTTSISAFFCGRINIDFLVSEIITSDYELLTNSGHTVQSLTEYFRTIPDNSIEGFWKYLDRDNDTRYCRLGGNYSLAIVHNADTHRFDIIYLSGAQINKDNWHEGMIKGHLIPTIFENHYDLIWFDSMQQPYRKESHALKEKDAILTLSLPLLESSFRFCRVPVTH
ncbi:MAG: hypothetical protein K2M94_05225 [Paramuribaculum sp.]|nr:hypothetical protein [Paramuribaculum sp.]